MAFDDDVYELWREKLKKIEALGQATYRSKFEFTHTIEKILANYTARSGEELEQTRANVRVAGRIMAIRLCSHPSNSKSHAGTSSSPTPAAPYCRLSARKSMSLQISRPQTPHGSDSTVSSVPARSALSNGGSK